MAKSFASDTFFPTVHSLFSGAEIMNIDLFKISARVYQQ